MRGLRLLRAPAALLGCLCVLLLFGGTPAYAHTALKTATPAPGSTVGTGTTVIALTFAQLKPGTIPKVGLVGPDGTAVPVGQPQVVDGSVACASVGSLPAGVDTLTYTVTATDDDVQSHSFQFQADEDTKADAVPAACAGLNLAAPATGDESGDAMILGLDRTTALVTLGAVVAVVVAGGAVVMRRSHRTRPTGRRRRAAV
ncbi:copper resistance protein CopC [Streptomyces canus]|uniref:copper resistance CopC family protein n=1 Tax=Streptomyces canus TaxID=58343 RepID=UPI002257E27F|nr:copper resistance protein CopC [Streptomyces canus]MCX4862186.1 copper resistance protein CopC [Streptomyces canus]WSW32822.1 copper resistance protein CopC [Streptomyces canus]